jgi:hypothetical protein
MARKHLVIALGDLVIGVQLLQRVPVQRQSYFR